MPDISTWAKALGGGLPIGAVIGKVDVMDGTRSGTIGGTYGGNPVTYAASRETIRLMEELQLKSRTMRIGRRVADLFRQFQKHFPKCIGGVRGLGAIVGVELLENGDLLKHATTYHRDGTGVELLENGDLLKPVTELAAGLLKTHVCRGLLISGSGMPTRCFFVSFAGMCRSGL